MISSSEIQTSRDVARHYDDLSEFYLRLWGEHLHHGFWRTGHEDVAEAVLQLVRLVAREARITPGCKVCDVGCGYGGTSRLLVEQYDALVTALTISKNQLAYARSLHPGQSNPKYMLQDWGCNTLAQNSFHSVIAIESTEHMQNKLRAFQEAKRVLKRKGRFVICAWLAAKDTADWQNHHILEPICREGRLPALGTAEDYEKLLTWAGLEVVRFKDLTDAVKPTWSVCSRKLLQSVLADGDLRAYLLDSAQANRVFALTVFRIWMAYQLGCLKYGLFTAVKP